MVLAAYDLYGRRLPNAWVLALCLLFIFYAAGAWWADGLSAQAIAWHLLIGLLAFVFMFALYVLGAMGGGDVKLGAVVYLWAGPDLTWPLTMIVAWGGGVLAILGWLADRRCAQRIGGRPGAGLLGAISAQKGVPYGVALAAGCLYVLWQHFKILGIQ
ncbi:A24 family peptidase [Castellaniella sp.]|uniref:A24 family peptidase n=1 Tax=Castellaniella sp. TaxID=1955812 RepID=UPI002AFE6C85|nr:prepilin peptidase [Castellaniella sp.]